MELITQQEVTYFHSISGGPTDGIKRSKDYAARLQPLIKKLNHWAKRVEGGGFVAQEDNRWTWSGGIVRSYLWIRVIDPRVKSIYFIVGCLGNGNLYCSMSHDDHNQNGLTAKARRAIRDHMARNGYQDLQIQAGTLPALSWESLIDIGRTFIATHLPLFEEIVQLATPLPVNATTATEDLRPSPAPESVPSRIPKQPSFKGGDVQWEERARTSKALGTAGEQFILKLERNRLLKAGVITRPEEVKQEQDGVGYDISSFDRNGNPIQIEVKTTTGSRNASFRMSQNERAYLQQAGPGYKLVRVFNFNLLTQRGEYYELSVAELREWDFRGVEFEVSKAGPKGE